jgi:hypothetical protein
MVMFGLFSNVSASNNIQTVQETGSPTQFPNVTGSNLSGKRYKLPADLEAKYNIIAIAFFQNHQAIVDTWMPTLKLIEATYEDVRYYEFPTVNDGGALFQSYLDGVMRAGIPNPDTRDRTITLYLDQRQFAKTLDLPLSTAHLLIVTPKGEILWRAAGRQTPTAAIELQNKLDSLTTLKVQR